MDKRSIMHQRPELSAKVSGFFQVHKSGKAESGVWAACREMVVILESFVVGWNGPDKPV